MTRLVTRPHPSLAGLLPVLLLLGPACRDVLPDPPVVGRISPPLLPAGSDVWVTIEGEGFEPRVTFDPISGALEVDDRFLVSFGGTPSPEVHRTPLGDLAARLPMGAPAGRLDIAIETPYGHRVVEATPLCVDTPQITAVFACNVSSDPWASLCESPLSGGAPQILVDDGVPAASRPVVSVAPGGDAIAFLERSGPRSVQLSLFWPEIGGARRIVAPGKPWLDMEDKAPADGRFPYTAGRFTPDGRTLVFLSEHRALEIARVPSDPDAFDPDADVTTRLKLPENPNALLDYLALDPTGRFAVASLIENPHPEGALYSEHHSIYLVELEGNGEPTPLLDDPDYSNGPAAFLPGGNTLLFVSNRTGLEVPIGFESGNPRMFAVQGLFTLDLKTLEVRQLTPLILVVFTGPPVVSPDGRWAALEGFLVDATGSIFDLLVVHLETGEVFRVLKDEGDGCGVLTQETCRSAEFAAEFGPDGRTLYFNSFRYANTGAAELRTYAVSLPKDGEVQTVANEVTSADRTLPRRYVTAAGRDQAGQRLRAVYAGCR